MRVVLAGGGSAGHIEPALALADALREADSGIAVTCLGTEAGLESRVVPMRGYELEFMPKVPLPRSFGADAFAMPGRLASAVHTVGQILDRVRADVVVGFGGYVAAPAYIAAKRRRVPSVVHEANPTPGFANRLGAMLTPYVYTGHPDTKLRGGEFIGLPIRRSIAELDRFKLGDEARAHFGLRSDLPALLVTGGSQGATSLNRALAGAIDSILSSGVQVLHVTGPKNAGDVRPQAPGGPAPYVAVPFVDRMDLAYAAADFALCRAGAMTCAELTAVGMPAAYVPLAHGNGEQRLNAQPIVTKGGGLMVEDADLTAEWIVSSLLPVLTDIDHVAAMSEAASSLAHREADRALARAVIDVVTREREAAAAIAARKTRAEVPAPPSQPALPPAAPPTQPFDAFRPAGQGGHSQHGHSQHGHPQQYSSPPPPQFPPARYPQQEYPPQGGPQQEQHPHGGPGRHRR